MKLFKEELNKEHQGAVAFEYIIILVIMVTAIMIIFNTLKPAVEAKVKDIKDTIEAIDTGTDPL